MLTDWKWGGGVLWLRAVISTLGLVQSPNNRLTRNRAVQSRTQSRWDALKLSRFRLDAVTSRAVLPRSSANASPPDPWIRRRLWPERLASAASSLNVQSVSAPLVTSPYRCSCWSTVESQFSHAWSHWFWPHTALLTGNVRTLANTFTASGNRLL